MNEKIEKVYDFLSGRIFCLDMQREEAKTTALYDELTAQIKEAKIIMEYLKA